LHRPALAQADSSRARPDSARVARDTVPRDTIKAPFARAPMPQPIEIGQSLVYDRASLFATGALTLQDLLDRVPGITGLRSGWIAAPMVSAYLGDVRRVRVFFDGLEFDELDPRTGGILDLTQLQLWTLEELRIERGASEVRVYARSWRVERTTAYTRTDIASGDQQTNLYRGYFGRRFGGGEGFQLGAQQYGTTPQLRGSPSSDELALLGRVGWARARWSVDAFALRSSRNRGSIKTLTLPGVLVPDSVATLRSSRVDAYARAAYGDPERGLWLQGLAGALAYRIQHGDQSSFSTATDTTVRDTLRFRAQYVIAGGFTRSGLRLDLTERLRVGDGKRLSTPSGRAEFVSGPLALAAFAEGPGPDSLARAEVLGRLTPLRFVSFAGAVGRSEERRTPDSTITSNFLRAEGAVRLFGVWLAGGFVQRDGVLLLPPRVFGKSYAPVLAPTARGATAAIRGTVYGPVKANITAIRWDDSSGFYRPRYQTRGELYVATNWLSRFPTGNFGLVASVTHEYRSSTKFPVTVSGQDGVNFVPDSRTLNFLLEIRIVSAVISYQFRNIKGDEYELVPGYLMPRQTQFYGVRWEFWN
jgi:hypothetical protein